MGFASDIKAWADQARAVVDAMPGEVAYEMAKVAVKQTAVDTGTLKGNWTVRINHQDATFRPAANDKDGQSTLALIKATLETARPGDVVYLINPTPYAGYVEFGTSKMRAQPMAAWAIEVFPTIVQIIAQRQR